MEERVGLMERMRSAVVKVLLGVVSIWCDKDGTPSCKRVMGTYILICYANSLQIAAEKGTDMPSGSDIAAWVGCTLIGMGTVTRMFKAIKGKDEEGQ